MTKLLVKQHKKTTVVKMEKGARAPPKTVHEYEFLQQELGQRVRVTTAEPLKFDVGDQVSHEDLAAAVKAAV